MARPSPAVNRLRLRELDPRARYRVSLWPSRADTVEQDNALVRGGDELLEIGLFLDVDRHEVSDQGDYWAQLFVLEAE